MALLRKLSVDVLCDIVKFLNWTSDRDIFKCLELNHTERLIIIEYWQSYTKFKLVKSIDGVRYYVNGIQHRDGNPAVILKNGRVEYWQNGILHRDNGPAIIREDGVQEWRINNMKQRYGDPAVIHPDGTNEWWWNNKRHRKGTDGPAIIRSDGTKEWWENGKRRNKFNWPSIVLSDGTKKWLHYDKLHREKGQPAIIYPDGRKEWWLHGIRIYDKKRIRKMRDEADHKEHLRHRKNAIAYLQEQEQSDSESEIDKRDLKKYKHVIKIAKAVEDALDRSKK